MRPLPLGIQSFEKIREGDFLYVDKTRSLLDLTANKGYYLLSRPRRFGKSVLISTLQALFSGKRELFKGLAIEKTNFAFQKHPVIYLDFSTIAHHDESALEKALLRKLHMHFDQADSSITANESLETAFENLVLTLHRQGKVVILVDEYDKPIISHITDREKAEANRNLLRRFYGVIKGLDPYLHMVFTTGITKFTKVSIFSELNNLYDLTLDQNYADMVGWTMEEVERDLHPHIQAFAADTGMTVEAALSALRDMYNGYRFSRKELTVFNPWSILNALQRRELANFWYDSGSPNFLIELLKHAMRKPGHFSVKDLNDYKYSARHSPSFDLENQDLATLLLQAGYLTIRRVTGDVRNAFLHLGFPNQEVEESFYTSVLEYLTPIGLGRSQMLLPQLGAALGQEDFETFFELLKSHFFANIPYDLHLPYERYYQTVFYTIFLLLDMVVQAEEKTNRGRIDQVIELPDKVFIFEMKYQGDVAAALAQIKKKGYDEKYRLLGKAVYHVGVAFSDRTIADYRVEKVVE